MDKIQNFQEDRLQGTPSGKDFQMLPSHHPSSWAGREFKTRPSVRILDLYLVVHSLSHVWLCDSTDCNLPGFAILHCPPEFAVTHVRWVGDTIQPSHPLLPSSSPAFNLSQPQGLFHWVGSSYQVAKVLEFQLQHQSFQWTNTQDWSLRWTGCISLQSKGLSSVLSSTTVQKHQFFSTQPSLWSNSHIRTWLSC